MQELLLITLLFTKHFVVDFLLQNKYQYSNKGIYGHPGGVLHATIHGLATALCFLWYSPELFIYLGILDAIIHYHIDWAKVRINARMKWSANTHEQFWWLLGLDQYLHTLTYIGLVTLTFIECV